MQLVLFVQLEACIHIKVSSQCSLKNKQWSDENSVCIILRCLPCPYVGVLYAAVIQNNKQEVRYVTQQRMNEWLILQNTPGHWLQSPGSEFPDTGVGWMLHHSSAFIFPLCPFCHLFSPLTSQQEHSQPLTGTVYLSGLNQKRVSVAKMLTLTAAVNLPFVFSGRTGLSWFTKWLFRNATLFTSTCPFFFFFFFW